MLELGTAFLAIGQGNPGANGDSANSFHCARRQRVKDASMIVVHARARMTIALPGEERETLRPLRTVERARALAHALRKSRDHGE
jgi:hypothetical protein